MNLDMENRVINGNRRAIALAGRIPVKVSTINGPIIAGDTITTSQIAGFGMRATEAGATLGTAMQTLIGVNDEHAEVIPCPAGTPAGVTCAKIIIMLAVSHNTGISTASNSTVQSQSLLAAINVTADKVEVSKSLVVNGQLSANGLVINGPAEFNGPAIFKALAEFLYTVVFRNEVKFEDHVAFSSDTVGMVTIPLGEDRIRIEFQKAYQAKPIVTANIVDGELSASGLVKQIEANVCSYGDSLEACQEKLRQNLLTNGARYVVTDINQTGFTILLDGPASQDYAFSWNAFASSASTP